MSFSCFPVELHLQVMCFMDPEDILALRKTSKYFLALTHEPRLWTAVYYRMRQTHPLGCPQSEFAALTPWQSERLLTRASKTEKVFQTFREPPQQRIIPSGQTRRIGPLTALAFLSERFLLSVDDTTVVYVWDISQLVSDGEAPAFPCTRLTLVGWDFVTYSMSSDCSTLFVVLAKDARAHVFSVALPMSTDETKLSFRDVAYVDTELNKVHSIDPDACLVLLQISDSVIEVVDWRAEERATFSLHQEATAVHAHRNYILALRTCGPYILCFRRWTIEAYPNPLRCLKPAPATPSPMPALRHTMPATAFTMKMVFSRVQRSRSPAGDVYTLCALAEDRRRGTFYYQVHVHTVPVPALSVRLLAIDGAHVDGRISAWDLGSTGYRGAWVLRPNSNGARPVVAFATSPAQYAPVDPTSAVDGGAVDVPPEVAPRFEEQIVSVMSSWHSDDDMTQCAVSEFTGRIALGSRAGAITVL